jgi:hypothetical protein
MKTVYRVMALLLVTLVLIACVWEETPEKNLAGDPQTALNRKLAGRWRFYYVGLHGDSYEEIRLRWDEGLGKFIFYYGGTDWITGENHDFWGGTIEYVDNFTEDTGIIIIKYLPGMKQTWMDWNTGFARDPQPVGNYYGIYFINLNNEGTKVFFACTSDQAKNYGPTETVTLEEAVAKFTTGNMNQMLDLSVGDPQIKEEWY